LAKINCRKFNRKRLRNDALMPASGRWHTRPMGDALVAPPVNDKLLPQLRK
jgi:hypothetical protein